MAYIPAIAAIAALIFGPQLWVQYVISRHGRTRQDYPGTGAEMARHLLDLHGLEAVTVETTDAGDHYDPTSRTVRLLPRHHDGRSVSAVAIAAHEVGHALQHAGGDRLLAARSGIVGVTVWLRRIVTVLLFALPVVALVVRSPAVLGAQLAIIVAVMAVEVVLHLVTLPVELDASFGKALPLLRQGRYLPDGDYPAVRSVLRAAALTYFAASLIGLLNFWRYARLLRI